MNIIICTLLFFCMTFLKSVQSMNQPPPHNGIQQLQHNGNQQPRHDGNQQPENNQYVLKYQDRLWWFNGEPYAEEYSTGLLTLIPSKYASVRDLLVPAKVRRKVEKRLRQLRRRPVLRPRLQNGDLIYHRGTPVGIVEEDGAALSEIGPPEEVHRPQYQACNGDILVLKGDPKTWRTFRNGFPVNVQGKQPRT